MALDQTLSNRLRERAKLTIRGGFAKANLDLVRDPYVARVVRIMQSNGIDTVIDVGANVGQYASMLRTFGFDGQIVSCEPLSAAYAELSKRSRRDERWTALNSAVGAEPGEITINVSANSYSSSVLEITDRHVDAAPASRIIGAEIVPLTTVADLVTSHGIDPARTLLKVDTQGFEPAVLDGAGELMREFKAVQLELSFVELYAEQDLFEAMNARIRGYGLEMASLEPGFSEPSGRLLQCDALFVRDFGVTA